MTKLNRKYFCGMGFALTWNVYNEVIHGNHSLFRLGQLMRLGDIFSPDSARRYAEVLLDKGVEGRKVVKALIDGVNRRHYSREAQDTFYDEFRDWGLGDSRRSNGG